MRILVVENREDDADLVRQAVAERCADAEVAIAGSRDSAVAAVESGRFDLVICDLSVPTSDGALDEDPRHGWAVVSHCDEVRPGTPVFVLTGTRTDDEAARIVDRANKQDLYGTGTDERVFDFFRKHLMESCFEQVARAYRERAALRAIEVAAAGETLDLDPWEKRVIQIYCRRRGAPIARAFDLGGGLSGTRVVGFRTEDAGGNTSRSVVRIGSLTEIEAEHEQYRTHIAGVLPGGCYATFTDKVTCGAGGLAGLFYELLDGHDRTLFDLLGDAPAEAAATVSRIRQNAAPWTNALQNVETRVSNVRQFSVSDEEFETAMAECDEDTMRSLDQHPVFVHQCRSHRDLHGANVLVCREAKPIIIDFGDVGESQAALDPVTLEFSPVFHPLGRRVAGDWPSPTLAASWQDLDVYLEGCPFPDFVRACREWATEVAMGERELCLTVYAHALRQLKYDGPTREVALVVANSAAARALHLYS